MNTVKDSKFWDDLWRLYPTSPSIAFCRVPELEFASQLDIKGTVLDHCCGDGLFAELAWGKQQVAFGCDIDTDATQKARKNKIYGQVDDCDVSVKLPYQDNFFDLVFNNSALEHVENIDSALKEVARVLKPNGVFAFNVLNHRYFEWWALEKKVLEAYKVWQPFFHAWSSDEWRQRLAQVGLELVTIEGYFDENASKKLSLLDAEFSGFYLANRPSSLVKTYKQSVWFWRRYWMLRLANIQWRTDLERGAGYSFKAVKRV